MHCVVYFSLSEVLLKMEFRLQRLKFCSVSRFYNRSVLNVPFFTYGLASESGYLVVLVLDSYK